MECNLCLKAVTMLLALHEDMQGTVTRLEGNRPVGTALSEKG